MINLYIDTEFSDLHIHTKKLISVGVYGVSSDGKQHSFYCELSDTYTRKDCSTFVKQIVLPLLEGKNVLRYDEMILSLGKFIEDIGEDVCLASDAPAWDFSFFTDFLDKDELRPSNIRHIALIREHRQIPEESYMREHHALDDSVINYLMVKDLLKDGYEPIKILKTYY